MVYLVSGGAADGAPRRCERVEFARMRVVRTSAVPACVRRHGASSTDRKTGADNVTTPRRWLLISGHGGRSDERVARAGTIVDVRVILAPSSPQSGR